MDSTFEYAKKIVCPLLVTISGSPGSGKSTAAKEVCRILGAQRLYVGQIRRDMAAQRGMTIEAFNHYALDHPETDIDVDNQVAANARRLYQAGGSILVEGRTQFHFLPESIKVYIFTELVEGARRIFEDLNTKEVTVRNESAVETLDEMIEKVRAREENDAQRYIKYYGFDHRDHHHYDRIIDSTQLSKEKVVHDLLRSIYGHQQTLPRN